MASDPASTGDVESVRSELQRLGYLTHRVERFLLQDALKPERPLETVTLLAAKLGLLGGALIAVGGALLLLAWNPVLVTAPLDLAVLVLHLFPISAIVFGLSFLLLAGVLAALLRFRPGLRIEGLSLAVGVAGGFALLGALLWRGRDELASLAPLPVLLLAIGAAIAGYVTGRLLQQGLLALAIRLTDRAPRRRLLPQRYLLPTVALAALALVALPAAVAAGHDATPPSGFLPTVRGDRVLLLGIDGVEPGELDYLVRRGALPTFARLASEGGALVRYERPDEAPAAFWTTLATGVPSSKHGVAAVDSFRPAGMETALAVNGPFRWYWARVEAPLGLATQRPLLSSRRDAFTFWELVGRGGAPIVAVDWWGTYPAGASPGLVVAHGAYQLLVEKASGAVAPTSRVAELAELRRRSAEEGEETSVGVARAALPQAAAQRLAERALLADRFYRMAFDTEARRSPQAGALYLPAVDLAADGWNGGEVAFTDLLGAELVAADRMLGALLDDDHGDRFATVMIVLDPGRRGGREGRAIIWRRAGCGASGRAATTTTAASLPIVEPEALASGLFRAVGLPQSGELPSPPAVCTWPAPPVTVPGFGRRQSTPAVDASDEYLQNLRSLGYV